MPPAQYAWSVHIMLSCYFVLLMPKVAGHTCAIPIITTLIVLNCLKMLIRGKKTAFEISTMVTPTKKKAKAMVLTCPICRGEVKGWTVVESARRFLNRKRRTCMHEDCSFVGTYKKLRKHAKSKHHSSKPCGVDPARIAEWKEFECEKERQDAISIISALHPGSVIEGDYIIDPNTSGNDYFSDDSDYDDFCTSVGSHHTGFIRHWGF